MKKTIALVLLFASLGYAGITNIPGGGISSSSSGGSSSLSVNSSGVQVTSPTAQINFVGSGVSVSATGSTATVTINGGGGAGYQVQPATVPFQLSQGFTASTGTITSLTEGTSVYANYGSSGTITPDANLGNNVQITLSSTATLNIPLNANNFQTFRFRIIQDGTGSRTVTLGTGFSFGNEIPSISISTTANSVSYFGCVYYTTTGKCHVVTSPMTGY